MKTHKITNQIIEIGMHYANTKHTTQTKRQSDFPGVLMAPCSSQALAARAASAAEDGHSPAVTSPEPLTHGTSLPETQKIPSLRHCLLFETSLSYKWLMLHTLPKRPKLSPVIILQHTVLPVLPKISQSLTEEQICSYFV